VEEL
jgi:ribonucleoside-diphosphate reductase subunit M1